jgi:hypothetical protein
MLILINKRESRVNAWPLCYLRGSVNGGALEVFDRPVS